MRRPQKTSRTMACVLMVVAAVLTACSSSSSQPTAKAFSNSQTQRFDELVHAAIGIHQLPGVVVSIDDPSRGVNASSQSGDLGGRDIWLPLVRYLYPASLPSQ
jgi:succinate dehydrogenase hydrophobic anchor subunit